MTTTTKGRRRTTATGRKTSKKAEKLRELHEQMAEFEARTDPAVITAAIGRLGERYSSNNVMLILMQCPNATIVNGYKQWQELGRQVRRGEPGSVINAFAGMREGKDGEEKPGFQGAYVWDIAQTDEIEEQPAIEAAPGEGPQAGGDFDEEDNFR
jgi:hypothetical protein